MATFSKTQEEHLGSVGDSRKFPFAIVPRQRSVAAVAGRLSQEHHYLIFFTARHCVPDASRSIPRLEWLGNVRRAAGIASEGKWGGERKAPAAS